MKTEYQIRNPRLDGIYIGFDTEWEAMRYWRENVENVPKTNLIHGAVVVRHTWETHQEAETARLDFMISPASTAKFSEACLAVDQDLVRDDWPKAARLAIDCARRSPPSTATVIWPNVPDQPRP
jgi:hypothetical protein